MAWQLEGRRHTSRLGMRAAEEASRSGTSSQDPHSSRRGSSPARGLPRGYLFMRSVDGTALQRLVDADDRFDVVDVEERVSRNRECAVGGALSSACLRGHKRYRDCARWGKTPCE